MADLNPRQLEAVHYLGGPLLVLAGAGSGKTRVITQKIAFLIGEAGVRAHNIAAVTFTNKAAREMKARVGQLLKGQDSRGLRVSTFHNLGLDILRREHKAAGLRPGFTILDEQDVEHLLKELSHKDHSDKDVIAAARRRISHWKNELLSPEQAVKQAETDLDSAQARLYLAYQQALGAYNAVDFDELILKPVQLFQADELLERWRSRITYLLVDEYQDTNGAQYELVRKLTGVRGALTVVGDDDQSIYAWRGARPDNLNRLQQDFPQLRVVKLEQNYRSTNTILKAANQLIANNPHLFDKALWSKLEGGDLLRVLDCRDEEGEAERVVAEILAHKFQHRTSHGDYAILYRGNHQARPFEKALRTHNIPYFLSGGTSFFSRAEVKDVMAYLRLLANPEDDSAFLRIVNTPRREIGPQTLEQLAGYATERNTHLLNACTEFGLGQVLSAKAQKNLSEFAHWVKHMTRMAHQEHPVQGVRQLLKDIDYEDWLRRTSPNDKAAERRWSNVEDLLEWLDRLHKDEMRGENLAQMVSHLALMDVLERREEESGEDDRVFMMTLHAAKGLEFKHVFLIGMEEELLPHHASIEDDNIEEERRLAYVGITRAQRTLTFTYAKKRRRGGELVECQPSRFLAELPPELMEWAAQKGPLSKEEKKQRGSAHLANLKAMLGEG